MRKAFLILFLIIFYNANLHAQDYTWHSYAYSGYAWSKKAGFINPDPTIFATPTEGNDDNILRNAPFGGMALQRSIFSWLDFGFSYDFYAIFAYQKFHNSALQQIESLEFLSGQYQRQFSLQHQSAMVDLFLKFPKSWCIARNDLLFSPVVGGSVGVGINNMMGFRTINHNFFAQNTNITSIAKNNISKSWAWRLEAGLKFESLNSNLAFGVTYRYYCGGRFTSGTKYMLGDIFSPGEIVYLPAWQGVLKTNQIKLYININFD